MSSIRSIFVSDVHLGCRYTHAEALLHFLRSHEPEHLYLVGDIIDGWRLSRAWYWTDTYGQALLTEYDLAYADVGFREDGAGRAVIGSRWFEDEATVLLEVWADGFAPVYVEVDLCWCGPDVMVSVPFQ